MNTHIENDFQERWCGYGGHFTMNLSKTGFIEHIHACERELCEKLKDKKKE